MLKVMIKNSLLFYCLFLTFVVVAKPTSIIGTWKINEASNTHINKLSEEGQFATMIIAEILPDFKFFNNGKFRAGEGSQGTWRKEKTGYSILMKDEKGKGKRSKPPLMLTDAGKLKVTFDEGLYLIYDRYAVTNKDKQDATKIAQIKKIIPYEKMFRTQKKNFMGYFNYLLISRDGTIYTMINKTGRHISAKDFKASAAIKELLVEKSVRADYTVTANGIYSSTGNDDKIKILSPRQVQFRDETYDIQ